MTPPPIDAATVAELKLLAVKYQEAEADLSGNSERFIGNYYHRLAWLAPALIAAAEENVRLRARVAELEAGKGL